MGKHVSSKKKNPEKRRLDLNNVISTVSVKEESPSAVLEIIKIATAFALLLLISFFRLEGIIRLLAFLIPFFIISFDVILSVLTNVRKGSISDDSLIILATAVLAFLIGKYAEAVCIVLFYRLCMLGLKILEQNTQAKRDALKADAKDTGLLWTESGPYRVDLSGMRSDEILLLRKGEILQNDGILVDEDCTADIAFLVGESTVRNFHAGEFVPSGSVNVSAGNVRIRVQTEKTESIFGILQDRIDHSSLRDSFLERKLKKAFHILDLARLPAALILMVLPAALTGKWSDWIARGIIFLIATNTSVVRRIVSILFRDCILLAAGQGIFFKSNEAVEKLERAQTFVFEKTGVISDGEFEIRDMKAIGISEKDLFGFICKAEMLSNSPVSYAFRKLFDDSALGRFTMDHFREIPGKGITAVINGKRICVGSYSFVSASCRYHTPPTVTGTSVHLAVDGEYAGYILLADRLKEGVFDALEKLRANNVGNLVLLTEDSATASRKLASSLNFDMVRAEVTPDEKQISIEYLIKNKVRNSWVAFVGSRSTAAELFTASDVSFLLHTPDARMTNIAADVLLFTPAVSRIADSVEICVSSMRKTKILTLFLLGSAGLILLLGLFGVFGILAALIFLMIAATAGFLYSRFGR